MENAARFLLRRIGTSVMNGVIRLGLDLRPDIASEQPTQLVAPPIRRGDEGTGCGPKADTPP